MKTLSELFQHHPQLLGDYITHSRQLAVLLVDAAGIICDFNAYFEELLSSPHPILGQPLQAFLTEPLVLPTLQTSQWQSVRLPIQIKQTGHLFTGHIIPIEDGFLIIAHTFRANHQQTFETLSRITIELTDITRELNRKNRDLKAANERITQLMNTDPLTGLANRRYLKEILDRELSSARRHKLHLSALMADIDHFKSVNDTYGHDVGDMVLVSVSHSLKDASRKEDLVARFGGEEFVIVLPDAPLEDALQCAERMRKRIEGLAFPGIDKPVTASFGATEFLFTEEAEALLKRADEALYEAKHGGRNRVVFK